LAFITGALMFFLLALSERSVIFFLVSIPFLFGGWKVFTNALPYRWKDQLVPVGLVLLGFGWLLTFLAWPIFHR
jgi:hypothetical protein